MDRDPNSVKLNRYDANPKEWDTRKLTFMDLAAWSVKDCTYRDVLEMCRCIPPITRRGESHASATKTLSVKERSCQILERTVSEPEWIERGILSLKARFDEPYPTEHRTQLAKYLMIDRYKPTPAETDERLTDKFHLDLILEPAAVIATSMLGEQVTASFAAQQNDTVGDLNVKIADRPYITAESKRGVVFVTHQAAFLALAGRAFPWPGRTETPPEAVRIWIQIWAQMVEYDVLYGKVFSPLGTVYLYRHRHGKVLYHSKVYADMDDEVLRSTALILLARFPPAAPFPTRIIGAVVHEPLVQSILWWFKELMIRLTLLVALINGLRGIAVRQSNGYTLFYAVGRDGISPTLFSARLGSGATGTVLRSVDGQYVLKVFADEETARTEARVLKRCLDYPDIYAPRFLGLYSSSHTFGIVMPYAGTAIKDIFSATDDQKQKLVSIIRILHSKGIHHHDVRSENIMVNNLGHITLVDYDRATIGDAGCTYCPDLEVVDMLERSMDSIDLRGGFI